MLYILPAGCPAHNSHNPSTMTAIAQGSFHTVGISILPFPPRSNCSIGKDPNMIHLYCNFNSLPLIEKLRGCKWDRKALFWFFFSKRLNKCWCQISCLTPVGEGIPSLTAVTVIKRGKDSPQILLGVELIVATIGLIPDGWDFAFICLICKQRQIIKSCMGRIIMFCPNYTVTFVVSIVGLYGTGLAGRNLMCHDTSKPANELRSFVMLNAWMVEFAVRV